MENLKRNLITIFGAICLVVIVLTSNLLIQDYVNLRIDCTTDAKFTLSDASLRLLKNLQAPIEIRFFYSKD
ncbi:MAG: hypothetical protein ACRC37_02670, partial [Lentisphaeria bacterium]